jgi:NDP-sugar pyrophosphorylase family protein
MSGFAETAHENQQVVILAGGLATRMHPHTLRVPKSLLPVAGKPFIAWQLEALRACGFCNVVLCVGHLGDQIQNYVGNGAAFSLDIVYSNEKERLLGTAGALRNALELLEPAFLVTYGDSYLPFDYGAPLRDLLQHPTALGILSVFENRGAWDRSNIEVHEEQVVRYEKDASDPKLTFIDYGAMALRRSVIEALPSGAFASLSDVQAALAAQGTLRAFHAHERFYEVGSPEGLRDLERRLGQA